MSTWPKNKTLCFVCHPYSDRKDTGRGHDRYAGELISAVRNRGVSCLVKHSGYVANERQGVVAEAVFPFRLFPVHAAIYHATATVCARVPIWFGKHPLVTTIHDCIPLQFKDEYDTSLKYRYKTYCLELAARHSDALVVPFASNRQIMHDRLNVPYERMFAVQYGIDSERFVVDPKVEKVPGRVLFVGEAVRAKGVDTLIEAMPRIVDAVPYAHLWVGSGGREWEMLKSLAASKNLGEHIRFLGYIRDDLLPQLYREAEVFVFPSRYGTGLMTAEAMACGTATVSGDSLDARDAYGDATCWVNPNDPQELAETVIGLLGNQNLRDEYIARGLRLSAKRSWAMMADEMIELYRNLLDA